MIQIVRRKETCSLWPQPHSVMVELLGPCLMMMLHPPINLVSLSCRMFFLLQWVFLLACYLSLHQFMSLLSLLSSLFLCRLVCQLTGMLVGVTVVVAAVMVVEVEVMVVVVEGMMAEVVVVVVVAEVVVVVAEVVMVAAWAVVWAVLVLVL